MNITDLLEADNIAGLLSEKELADIAEEAKQAYDLDRESRSDWEEAYGNWLDMTLQKIEVKTKPWPGAANIKYPQMTQAALQFNARALPALIPNSEPVGVGKVGPDLSGGKTKMATAIAGHMNYQLTTEMEEWESEFDTLLMALPVSGMEYKKVYYDSVKGRNVSRHVTPFHLVVNYYADSLAESRKTEIHKWNKNKIIEGIASGKFEEVDWEKIGEPTTGKLSDTEEDNAERVGRREPSKADSSTGYVVLEYHGWLDLDDDGYAEPYIVTYMEESLTVLEIVPRYTVNSIVRTQTIDGSEGNLISIIADESYVKYGLIPNPDGSFYDIGFGNLLYPINAVVNTAINMMLDAGASSIMNSGFLGRGIKMRGGMFTMAPNTWMSVNTSGDDIRKSFVPMPTKEPSMVLYQLMAYMVEAGQKLSGTTDIFTGEMPGQNTKSGVTQAVRDEGQKVFTAIHKRLRRVLKAELGLLFSLNGQVLGAGQVAASTKIAKSAAIFEVTAEMYSADNMIIQPSADPNIAIKEQRMQKDLTVYQMISESGIGDKAEAQRRVLTTMEVENMEKIQPEGSQAPPDPKAQIEQAKVEMEKQSKQVEASQADFDAEMKEKEFKLKAWTAQMELKLAWAKMMNGADMNAARLGLDKADFEFQVELAEEAKEKDDNDNGATAPSDTGSMGGMEGSSM